MWQTHKNDFPVLRHNQNISYLDYAATSFMPDAVLNARAEYDTTIGVSINRGIGVLSQRAERIFEDSTLTIKDFWNAADYELIYTKNATESLNLLAESLSANVGVGDIILLSEYEHHSNLLPWKRIAKRKDACIVLLPIMPDGELDYSLLDILPKERVKIVSLNMLSNVTGYRLDTDRIKKYVSGTNIFWILDVSQAVGHIQLDFMMISADAFCMSAHKMYGPKNIGGCLVNRNKLHLLAPFMLGGGMVWNTLGGELEWRPGASKFEAGTFDISLVASWGRACTYIKQIGFSEIKTHEDALYDLFLSAFANDSRVNILPSGPGKKSLCSFEIEKCHPHDIATAFLKKNIEIRTGHMCSQTTLQAFGRNSVCRISWGIGTETRDLESVISNIKKTGI